MARKKGLDMDTRLALIDAALDLIASAGFDATPVDAIVARAGLSKGTFFHFFPAKRDLLEAASERLAQQSWEAVQASLTGPGDPLLRLARFVAETRSFRVDRASRTGELWEALAREENARVRTQVRLRNRELVLPAFTRLVAEGAACGQFQASDPEITAQLVLEFAEASADETMRLLRRSDATVLPLARRRVNATMEALERALGAPPGTLVRVSDDTLKPFIDRERS